MNNQIQNLDVFNLYGGMDEPLRTITGNIRKPMFKIKGKPILFYILTYFQTQGIQNIFSAFKHDRLHIAVNTVEEQSLAEKNIVNIFR